MSAPEVTSETLWALDEGQVGFAVLNYANADMVGRQFEKAVRQGRVDYEIAEIRKRCAEKRYCPTTQTMAMRK